MRTPRRLLIAVYLGLSLTALPSAASAFCGFYVTGADTKLYANATMVVMMRDGTRTVLSIQNNYQGPPEAFALVIPVPSVLSQEQVKILPRDVFEHVDVLGAPRLVEYWEDDPCRPPVPLTVPPSTPAPQAASGAAPTVKVEAQFAVGEYDVVILSANDSSALDSWLRSNKYNIPEGAQDVLAPYVAAGTKFFVAKVDPGRVTFVNEQAVLSPLRFHYDTQEFSLPVRLGLLNSRGDQDLIVSILAPSRYEAANYPNVTIPTNLRVQDSVRSSFPSFYEALFSKLLEKNPGAVVTEYSWASSSCDPCPTPPLTPSDLATLGADVTTNMTSNTPGQAFPNYTLTRLHYRYTKESLGQDLVFRQADAIVGGRGIPDPKGQLAMENEAAPSSFNNFQGRYVILHPWAEELKCQSPQRGSWGGPSGGSPMTQGNRNTALTGAAPVAGDLTSQLAQSLPRLDVIVPPPPAAQGGSGAGAGKGAAAAGKSAGGSAAVSSSTGGAPATTPATPSTPTPTPAHAKSGGCGVAGAPASDAEGFLALGVLGILWRGRRVRRAVLP